MSTPARRHAAPRTDRSFRPLNNTGPGRYCIVRAMGEESGDPAVCYTFGLHNSGLQEFVVSGKLKAAASDMIRCAIEAARSHPGHHLPPGAIIPMPDGTLLKARALTKDEAWYLLYEVHAMEVQATEANARVIQLLWPDRKGRFPGEGAYAACEDRQRLSG